MQTLTLKTDREKSIRRRHPWLFESAVALTEGSADDGLCVVRSRSGESLGAGIVSPGAALRARIVRFDGRALDEAWIAGVVRDALALRNRMIPADTDAFRLIHSEGDLVPGIIADRYADVLSLQATTAGAEAILPWVVAAIESVWKPRTIVHRRDLAQREYEGLSSRSEVVGDELPAEGVAIRENGITYRVDALGGQKTGFFLDQRENRARIRSLSAGRSVLNVFSYTGGFGVAAAVGGASSTLNVDISLPALEVAKRNYAANGLDAPADAFLGADAFDWLREAKAAKRQFDIVVVDPPAFVKSKGALDRGLRGYKDINLQAMPLVAPGGLLFTCSCSGLVDHDLFQKVVFGASVDARVRFRLLERRGAGPDHPVLLDCPETEYLKALLLERID